MAGRQLPTTWEEFQSWIRSHALHWRRGIRPLTGSRDQSYFALLKRFVLRVDVALLLFWVWLLHWGEVSVYEQEVAKCDWHTWEKWPSTAGPHHVAFIADPQLIDPHTYPGRPWPLSSLTIAFTDKYLKRSYRKINERLDPDTLYFLGDLFDGGREWDTDKSDFKASERQWERYGRRYWYGEYKRFARIFLASDQISGGLPYRRDKEVILSLPGNHDLGFADGVQFSVRSRFRTYFGQTDRVDIIGNHTFVGIDSVSLSALDVKAAHEHLWKPTSEFLDGALQAKRAATEHYLKRSYEYRDGRKFSHRVSAPEDQVLLRTPHAKNYELAPANLPTVLLSHVPLYRDARTPCGPLRERWPPEDPNNHGPQNDERNSLRIASGYQYQNVLSKELSTLITKKIGRISYAFSGDDHDYCDVVHRNYASAGAGIREITVKSISWAMGIKRPGIVLASLYNPIDDNGDALPGSPQAVRAPTLQSHLCLMPTQIDVFIRYGFYLFWTVLILIGSAARTTYNDRNRLVLSPVSSLLPTKETDRKRNKSRPRGLSNGTDLSGNGYLAARSANARARSVSPNGAADGYGLPSPSEAKGPLIERAGNFGRDRSRDVDEDAWIDELEFEMKPLSRRRRSFVAQTARSFGASLLWVGVPGFAWFLYLWHNY